MVDCPELIIYANGVHLSAIWENTALVNKVWAILGRIQTFEKKRVRFENIQGFDTLNLLG